MSDTNTNEQKTVGYNGLERYDNKIKTYIQNKIDSSGTGGSVTVDNELSDTSENPVQNKVIKAELDKKANKAIYGDNSINLGRNPDKTAGTSSIAMGTDVEASGIHAHAEGLNTSAIGNYAFAGGIDTEVKGNVSFAYGEGLKASKYYSAAFGIYNSFDENTLFSIGNGDSDTERSNAFEVTKTGGKLHDKDIATVDMIPESAIITEDTIAGWGFTKNTGTYSKPSGGIPETDLASAVQTSLDKADNALPLSGGAMTGNISYKGTKATIPAIKFIDNTADVNGNGISIGSGGLTIIGGGKSSDTVSNQFTADKEKMIIANAAEIDFYPNCQNGFASAKHITMNKDGSVTTEYVNISSKATVKYDSSTESITFSFI